MRSTAFTRARWATGLGVALALASMLAYPGGTPLDHATIGYSPAENFLSDLGMTVAFNGEANRLGATLFVLALVILVLGFGGCLRGFVRLCSESPRSRRFARAAAVVGVVVCAAFIGVALTPENSAFGAHMWFTLFAFRTFPFVSLLFALAFLTSGVFSTRALAAWLVLTVILVGFVGVLSWGPSLSTQYGLMFQVIAQKTVAIAAVSIFFYLSVEADRILAASRRRMAPTIGC